MFTKFCNIADIEKYTLALNMTLHKIQDGARLRFAISVYWRLCGSERDKNKKKM